MDKQSSIGRQLESSFSNSELSKPKIEIEIKAQEELLMSALGVVANNMEESVISDISGMIEKEDRRAIDGYVLCLSRIMKHENAWNFICKAFQSKGEAVPSKYRKAFGMQETAATSNMKVQ